MATLSRIEYLREKHCVVFAIFEHLVRIKVRSRFLMESALWGQQHSWIEIPTFFLLFFFSVGCYVLNASWKISSPRVCNYPLSLSNLLWLLSSFSKSEEMSKSYKWMYCQFDTQHINTYNDSVLVSVHCFNFCPFSFSTGRIILLLRKWETNRDFRLYKKGPKNLGVCKMIPIFP